MNTRSPKYFYTTDSWDETDWLDIVSIEYETLISGFDFDVALGGISNSRPLKVLDVGCGSAIFPQYLEPTLSDSMHLSCDLLDVSGRSLEQSRRVLDDLRHFSANQSIQALIEDIPSAFPAPGPVYHAIWAIHSFTTVDLPRMAEVLAHLVRILSHGGQLFIYQLAVDSTYQVLHQTYRQRVSAKVPRFMAAEDTMQILDSLRLSYEVAEFHFEHELPLDRPDLVEHYLRKCALDEFVDTGQVFGDLLAEYGDGHMVRFPQHVDLIRVFKT